MADMPVDIKMICQLWCQNRHLASRATVNPEAVGWCAVAHQLAQHTTAPFAQGRGGTRKWLCARRKIPSAPILNSCESVTRWFRGN